MYATRQTCLLTSPDQTCQMAASLAPRLRVGDVLLLSGDVGAGKTHFARCLIQAALPVPEDVPSPTYTLVQTYAGQGSEIWHADLYRLSDVTEVIELGLTDAFETAICLVEWPDRLGDLAPAQALRITLTALDDPDHRRMDLHWSDPKWQDRLEGLCDE